MLIFFFFCLIAFIKRDGQPDLVGQLGSFCCESSLSETSAAGFDALRRVLLMAWFNHSSKIWQASDENSESPRITCVMKSRLLSAWPQSPSKPYSCCPLVIIVSSCRQEQSLARLICHLVQRGPALGLGFWVLL